jgi:fluoride ion exporter CrcB/FEX
LERDAVRSKSPICLAFVVEEPKPQRHHPAHAGFGDTSHIPWPWSFICAIVFGAVIAMLFIWLGVAVYSTFRLLAHSNLSLRSVRKGFLWGLVAYGVAQACKLAIGIHYPQPPSHAEHWGSLTVLGVLENFGTWSTLVRFPDFIRTATTLWFLESRDKPEQVRAA